MQLLHFGIDQSPLSIKTCYLTLLCEHFGLLMHGQTYIRYHPPHFYFLKCKNLNRHTTTTITPRTMLIKITMFVYWIIGYGGMGHYTGLQCWLVRYVGLLGLQVSRAWKSYIAHLVLRRQRIGHCCVRPWFPC